MPRACPSCGTENPDQARFCFACGTPLETTPSAGRKERKFATALFADLVGSTALAEREDPEVVQSVVSRAFDRLAQEVERYGGLLEKFMGDAVLAVFGVPTSHEDDPERAVRAALEMHAVLSELNRGFVAEGKPELAMRIGIEAGEVLVDMDRVAGPRDRMLTGDAVNIAARLQSAADPGSVLVGPGVRAATKNVIDYQELAPLTLKGKAEPVPAWQALRISAQRRGERPKLGLEARLIGRDEELMLLKQTYQRVESEGRPALITVMGPAGVGKSRLSLEFFRHVDEELPQVVYWRKGRCLAYGNVSYSALAEAVKAQCEILEDDPPDVAADKANRATEDLFGDRSVVSEIRTLVGAPAERSASREELFEAWRRFLERMAARYPLVLVLEDIHWADEGLLDFIDHMADWATGPILLLTMARPELLERRPSWGGGKRNFSALYLDPLTPTENEAMVDDLLAATLPQTLKQLVVERSEGNPLYTEEIVRMFIDRGVLRRDGDRWALAGDVADVDVPRSIQGLIAARLDSLPKEEKAVLQDAAVVGRTFWLGAAERLSGLASTRIRDVLGRLRVKEIVIPREPPAFSGEMEFAFRHVLIRDVAYDTLPKSLRADKHVEVATWAEARAGERSEEIAELLATHYREALRYLEELGEANGRRHRVTEAAFRWARTAGERAERLWQGQEAVGWYRVALDLAEIAGASPDDLAVLWERYGGAMWGVEPFSDVSSALEKAVERYLELGREREAGRVESKLSLAAFMGGRDQEVLPWMERALARLEPLGDSKDLAKALGHLGTYHWRRGNLHAAEPVLRRSMEIAARVGDLVTQGHSTQSLGIVLERSGRSREGIALVEESYRIGEAAGNLALRLRTANNFPTMIMDLEGGLQRARAILREGLELAVRTGQRDFEGWLAGTLGDLLLEEGDLKESERFQRQAVEAARAVDEAALLGMRLQGVAAVLVLKGEEDEALSLSAEAEAIIRENPEPQAESFVPWFRGTLAIGRGDIEAAIETFTTGADRFVTPDAVRLLIESVRLLARAGKTEEAHTYLDRLRRVAEERDFPLALAGWGSGVLEKDAHEAEATLLDAVEALERLQRRLDLARALADLAVAERRLGKDPAHTLLRARGILEESGALAYLRDVEWAEAELSTTHEGAEGLAATDPGAARA